jgi:single-strand DNA-binding protein
MRRNWMLNRHEIIGRFVRDPELTENTDETKNRCNFTVAVDDDYGDGTEFIDCAVFGKRAAVIDKYFHKGDGIFVAGKGSVHSYEGKDGVKRKSYSIMVRDFNFLPSGSRAEKPKEEPLSDSFEEQERDVPF